ncbi:hypothetical protein B1A_19687 [mine drainage metagenome]|uniref:Uncharacterized protein n=1 Tax=mine drainage metagenome TaxID=410659 RepID=T0YJ13_9ZZZZ
MSTLKLQPPITLRDPDLQKVLPALRRAAQNARELALRTGTPCHVWRDGKMVNIGASLPGAAPGKVFD